MTSHGLPVFIIAIFRRRIKRHTEKQGDFVRLHKPERFERPEIVQINKVFGCAGLAITIRNGI